MKGQIEDDEIEGDSATKCLKVDNISPISEVKEEETFSCIQLDQLCDVLDDDLVKLNSHQDCVKTVTSAVRVIVQECITTVSSAISAKVAN